MNIFSTIKNNPTLSRVGLFIVINIITIIAIIFLFRALNRNDVCDSMPGTTYNESVNMCLPECELDSTMCLNTDNTEKIGNCIKNNYCSRFGTNDDKLPYTYDKESCQCTITCPEGYLSYDLNGNQVNTTDDPVNNPLKCYKQCDSCDDSSKSVNCTRLGNNYYCGLNNICGKYNECTDNAPENCISINKGCYNIIDYKYCSTNSDVVCPVNQECQLDANGNPIGCKFELCGNTLETSGFKYACDKDSDCNIDGMAPNNKCDDKDSDCNKCIPYAEKGFQKAGFCENIKYPMSSGAFCIDPKTLGEKKDKTMAVCKDPNYPEGISLHWQHCKKSLANDTPCAKNICPDPNKWLAMPPDPSQCNLISQTPVTSINDNLSSGECCEPNQQRTNARGTKFCCTQNDLDQNNKYCANSSDNPLSKVMFTPTGSLLQSVPCDPNNTTQLDSYRTKFYNNLDITDKNPLNPYNSDGTANPFYADIYCKPDSNDPTTGKIHGYCGIYTGGEENSSNELIIFNDLKSSSEISGENVSGCYKKSNCQVIDNWESDLSYSLNNNGNELVFPICEGGVDNKKYWAPDEENLTQDYKSSRVLNINTSSPECSQNEAYNALLKRLQETPGARSLEKRKDSNNNVLPNSYLLDVNCKEYSNTGHKWLEMTSGKINELGPINKKIAPGYKGRPDALNNAPNCIVSDSSQCNNNFNFNSDNVYQNAFTESDGLCLINNIPGTDLGEFNVQGGVLLPTDNQYCPNGFKLDAPITATDSNINPTCLSK